MDIIYCQDHVYIVQEEPLHLQLLDLILENEQNNQVFYQTILMHAT